MSRLGDRSRPAKLLISNTSGEYGGMEVHVELVLKHLDRDRYQPTFYLPQDPFAPVPQQLVDHVRDLDVPILRDRRSPLSNLSTSVGNTVGFARALAESRSDILHIHTVVPDRPRYPLLAAKLARTAGVVRTEHLPPVEYSDSAHYVTVESASEEAKRSCKRYDRLCDVVLNVSEDNRRAHLRVYDRDPNKLKVLHNGIEIAPMTGSMERSESREMLGLDKDLPLLGTVGRLNPQKGYAILLDAIPLILRSFGEVNLVLVGDGDIRGELEDQSRALGIDKYVRFLGYIPNPSSIVSAFDIAVMPSVFEGFSLSMLEMMAAGKPCVFSDHPSFIEATNDGEFARLAKLGDPQALADSVIELLREPEQATILGLNARDHIIEHYSIDRHVRDLMSIYDELLFKGNQQ